MMMMMMMMMNCFSVVWLSDERRLALFTAGDHCHRSSLSVVAVTFTTPWLPLHLSVSINHYIPVITTMALWQLMHLGT